MKFLVDAQLPRRLTSLLNQNGYDAIHTLDLPKGNSTSDNIINKISLEEFRVVVTKDADFVQSFLLQQKPYKLLLVTTGNIRNADLEALFNTHILQIVNLFETYQYVEMSQASITVHQ